MSDLILGIDDAGRGPVIGPMVLAGCLIDKQTEKEFKSLGVKDSKQLTPRRREFLEKIIKEKAIAFEIEVMHASEIDEKLSSGVNLNDVEAIMAIKIINKINKGAKKIKVVLDCPSPNRTKWRGGVVMKIKNLSNLEVFCEHKADRDYVFVAAASILAKQKREREMDIIKQKYGYVGSGYPSDSKTKSFLEKNVKKLDNKGLFRKSWSTWKKAALKSKQKKLDF